MRHAIVLYKDDSYGHAVTEGFKRAADWLGVDADYRPYKNAAEAEVEAGLAAAAPGNPPIVVAAYDADTMPVLRELKRQGARGPILGTITMAGEYYNSLFADLPEQRQTPGFFTEGVYAVTPVVFDSGNAETLAFADRFRERFGREPTLYSAQGYETARLAIAAVRATSSPERRCGPEARRGRDPRLSGLPRQPDERRTRPQRAACGSRRIEAVSRRSGWGASRAGNSCRRRANSFPCVTPSLPRSNRAPWSKSVRAGSCATSRWSTPAYFSTRFRAWTSPSRRSRRTSTSGCGSPGVRTRPASIRPKSSSRRWCAAVSTLTSPVAQGDLDDGTTYRLWQVTGDFKNDYDLRHYPADRQTLAARIFQRASGVRQDRLRPGQEIIRLTGGLVGARERRLCRMVGAARAESAAPSAGARSGQPVRRRRGADRLFATSRNGIRCEPAKGATIS